LTVIGDVDKTDVIESDAQASSAAASDTPSPRQEALRITRIVSATTIQLLLPDPPSTVNTSLTLHATTTEDSTCHDVDDGDIDGDDNSDGDGEDGEAVAGGAETSLCAILGIPKEMSVKDILAFIEPYLSLLTQITIISQAHAAEPLSPLSSPVGKVPVPSAGGGPASEMQPLLLSKICVLEFAAEV
jgi:hypothetical protein